MTTVLEAVTQRAVPARTESRWLQVLTDLHPRYGGVSAAVPQLAQALRQEHVAAPVAALCAEDEQYRPAHLPADAVQFLPRGHRAWLQQHAPRAALHSAVSDADGVHVHGLWTAATPAVWRAAQRSGRPMCVSAHGMLEPWALQQRRVRKQIYAALVENRILRGAACLHALTDAEAHSYQLIAPRVPVAVIPNGVTVFRNSSSVPFTMRFAETRGRRIVLFLGRLHTKKGLDLLLQAWRVAHTQDAAAHLVIAGADEGMQPWVEAYIAEHGLQHCTTLAGLLDAPMKWSALAAAECFVLPSRSEGLSVAMLEALGMGVPVLATPQCNMPEVVSERCGWLVQPEVCALRDALCAMLERTPAENAVTGQRGRTLVERNYTWPRVAARMAAVYRWLNGGALLADAPADVEVLP